MTAWIRRRTGERRRGSGQGGFTLIEILVAIAISALLLVPLSAWTILALRQQPVLQDQMLRTATSGFLGSYWPSDVTIAGKAATDTTAAWASDCPGLGPGRGSVQAVMVTGGTDIYKAVYSEAPASDDASLRSVWRRTCDVGTGALLSVTEVFEDVVAGSTDVICTSQPGDSNCREMRLVTRARTQANPIQVSATRRLDEASVPVDADGDPRPNPVISELSRQRVQAASQEVVVTFSAANSSARNGSIVGYRWEFQGAGVVVLASPGGVDQSTVTAEFPSAGSYTAVLTVTDSRGKSATTHREVVTSNELPSAVVNVTPGAADVGATFALSAASSFDPDGSIVAYDWLVTLPSENGSGATVLLDPVVNPTYTPPAGTNGIVSVALTVTDNQGGRGTANGRFTVVDPTVTTTTLPGGSTTTTPGSTVPEQPGVLTASFVSSTSAAPATQSFDASATSGIGAGATATYAWEFGDGASGSGRNPDHTYPNAGQYTARLTVNTSDGRTASVTNLVNVGGAPPAPTNVRHDGSSVLWAVVPGARRYLVDFEFQTLTDCYRVIANQAVGLSTNPSKGIPANPCPSSATARARVGAEANGAVSWSEWIAVPALGTVVAPPTTTPEVVK